MKAKSKPSEPHNRVTSHKLSRRRYATIVKGLATLRRQLERAQQDIATLQELKRQALAAPEVFIEQLTRGEAAAPRRQYKQQGQDGDQEYLMHNEASTDKSQHNSTLLKLPELQKVTLLPNINLRPWLGRLPRRATTKYDQNLGIYQVSIMRRIPN